jgi:hypothetical protein
MGEACLGVTGDRQGIPISTLAKYFYGPKRLAGLSGTRDSDQKRFRARPQPGVREQPNLGGWNSQGYDASPLLALASGPLREIVS